MLSSLTLLAESGWPSFLNNSDTLALLIPITAILVGGTIAVAKLVIHHRERMAMIERGMHPDHPPESQEVPADQL